MPRAPPSGTGPREIVGVSLVNAALILSRSSSRPGSSWLVPAIHLQPRPSQLRAINAVIPERAPARTRNLEIPGLVLAQQPGMTAIDGLLRR
jgi:hypothetical protein